MKTKFKIFRIFLIASLVFWLSETAFFIIRDGWHLKAVTEAEKTCDNIASLLLTISFIFFYLVLYDIVKIFINANIKTVTYHNVKPFSKN